VYGSRTRQWKIPKSDAEAAPGDLLYTARGWHKFAARRPADQLASATAAI
jgi:hypothetical protein